MGRKTRSSKVSLRVKISTRLAWLSLNQTEFSDAIGMDKSVLSRVLRADCPHQKTLDRISLGLGMSAVDLLSGKPSSLLSDHPAFSRSLDKADRIECLRRWVSEKGASSDD